MHRWNKHRPVRLITPEDEEQGPILNSLLDLINEAITTGSTFKSWRRSIITMIPKKKEDGSLTSSVKEMRPISVLQEFSKIASKILADRLGQILLKHDEILNRAQRASSRMGVSTSV